MFSKMKALQKSPLVLPVDLLPIYKMIAINISMNPSILSVYS